MTTRDKRASALAAGLAFLTILPSPDGLVLDQGDRQQVAALYRGIPAGVLIRVEICTTTVDSLVPVRTVDSLVGIRTVESLVPVRTVEDYCP